MLYNLIDTTQTFNGQKCGARINYQYGALTREIKRLMMISIHLRKII